MKQTFRLQRYFVYLFSQFIQKRYKNALGNTKFNIYNQSTWNVNIAETLKRAE